MKTGLKNKVLSSTRFSITALVIGAMGGVIGLSSSSAFAKNESLNFRGETRVDYSKYFEPTYKKVNPNFSFEINGSVNAFGGHALTSTQGPWGIGALNLRGEYQPEFFQKFGVLGIGPSVTLYAPNAGGVTTRFPSLYGLGGQIRYQALYFRQQPIVPFVAYNFEYFRYTLQTGASGGVFATGPSLGLQLLMNSFDKKASTKMYMFYGIARTYLNLEYRILAGSDENIKYSGGGVYFGLRFEFK